MLYLCCPSRTPDTSSGRGKDRNDDGSLKSSISAIAYSIDVRQRWCLLARYNRVDILVRLVPRDRQELINRPPGRPT